MAKNKALEAIEESRAAIVAQLADLMERDGLAWANPVIGSGRPHNPISGTYYRGENLARVFVAMLANGWTDSRFVTYRQAREKGWQVRKGAESVLIVRYKQFQFTVKDDDGEEVVDDDGQPIVRRYTRPVGYFRVFNAADVEGMPAAEPVARRGDCSEIAAAEIDAFISSSRCEIALSAVRNMCYYSPVGDYVAMVARGAFRSDDDYLRTLLHEMTHSTCKPLGREIGGKFGSDAYAFEELVAELGAVFTANAIGYEIDLGSGEAGWLENHAAYLKVWIRQLQDSPEVFAKAAGQASRAADYLLERRAALIEADSDTTAEAQAA